ncbi:hypothetical protein [Allosphingosinicella sp.]|jgi:hypothetical protein
MTHNPETEIAEISAKEDALREELQQSTEINSKAQRVLQRRKAHLRTKPE